MSRSKGKSSTEEVSLSRNQLIYLRDLLADDIEDSNLGEIEMFDAQNVQRKVQGAISKIGGVSPR